MNEVTKRLKDIADAGHGQGDALALRGHGQ